MSIILSDARIHTIQSRMGFNFSKLTSIFGSDTGKARGEGVLGIDIGSSAIKFVQIQNAKGVPTLETYGELQLGPYEGIDIGRTTHLSARKTMEALADILREGSATGKQAVYSISYGASFTSNILVSTLDQEKIASMIPVEARKYIPIPLSKVTLDWIPLGTHEEEGVTNVLLSAVYNETEEHYKKIMKGTNLSVLESEIEIFSTIRSAISPGDERVAVFDFGASATRLYIVEKGVIKKTHSIPLSGLRLTDELSKELGVEFEEAERIKREFGLVDSDKNPRVQKILSKALEKGVRELHTVVKRYSDNEGVKIEKVVLSGGGALMRGIAPYISDTFSMPVGLADPFAKIAYPAFLEDTLKEAGSSFAVSVGVALRGLQDIN